ncbi:hypothetical protein CBR_g45861 [Chara braunii]|uniref:CCHC-type domain-containing protein n=1 Tax=Chara braunii TaxID=69332 RepID=A0A388LZG6_CHABU|nr:hypothetical protein CBR_g45861 [Chara braunii]|eukprot:GBG87707.1 hypothetical protein CBR_g45861 [Chara braunii]
MASQANLQITDNRSCYNCGQQGYISRFCPLPDKRLNGGHASTSTALVQAQPLVTGPSNVQGVAVGGASYSNQPNGYSNKKYSLRNRVSTLKDIVGRIKTKHDADEAKELAAKQETERRNKEKEEDERRLKDTQEREEQHSRLSQELSKQWKKICEKIDKCDQEANELAKLREDVARLTRAKEVVTLVHPINVDTDTMSNLRSEQEEMRAAADRRFAVMEERISSLTKSKEAAEASAELWKAEALWSGNKRGSIVLETPTSHARSRLKGTPRQEASIPGPSSVRTSRRTNPALKGIVDRHNMEVNLLKEMRLKDANGRIEAEKEVEKLKAEMVRLEMGQRQKGTNLKKRLDEVAGASTCKPPCPSSKKKGTAVATEVNDRDALLQMEKKNLCRKNKEEVQQICREEGIPYTTLEPTKELIAARRVEKAFGVDDRHKGKEKSSSVIEVTGGDSDAVERDDDADVAVS